MISRSLLKSTKDHGVWESHFPDYNRLQRLLKLEHEKSLKKGAPPPKTVKELLMSELNVVTNLTSKRRYLSYNLVGHTKMISCMDVKDGIVATGGYDNAVKVWDV